MWREKCRRMGINVKNVVMNLNSFSKWAIPRWMCARNVGRVRFGWMVDVWFAMVLSKLRRMKNAGCEEWTEACVCCGRWIGLVDKLTSEEIAFIVSVTATQVDSPADGSGVADKDSEFEDAWKHFHFEQAKYRYLCATCNQKMNGRKKK